MSPLTAFWLILVVVAGCGGYFTGAKIEKGRCDEEKVVAQQEKIASIQRAISQADALRSEDAAIAAGFESDAQKRRSLELTIRQRNRDDVAKNPAYRSCRLSDDGLRNWNAANTGRLDQSAADPGKPAGQVPGGTAGPATPDNGRVDRESRGNGLRVPRLQEAP